MQGFTGGCHGHGNTCDDKCNARGCTKNFSKKKQEKQHRLLTEVIVPESITPNLLTDYDIYNYIGVVDGGDLSNPSIRPPDGVTWLPISVMKGEHINRFLKKKTCFLS